MKKLIPLKYDIDGKDVIGFVASKLTGDYKIKISSNRILTIDPVPPAEELIQLKADFIAEYSELGEL